MLSSPILRIVPLPVRRCQFYTVDRALDLASIEA
jgi:hypothetical protein